MLHRSRTLLLAAMVLLGMAAASCGPLPKDRPGTLSGRTVKVVQLPELSDPNSAVQHPADPNDGTGPLVEFWDNGNFLNNRPSSLLFAVWRDGKVMRLLNGRTYVGYISAAEVSRLINRLAVSGVESAPFSSGVIYPDGGSQLLYIESNGVQIALRHDNSVGVTDLENYELPPNITRQQLVSFINIWTRSVSALEDVWPLHLDLVAGMPAVPYPSVP